MKAKSYDGDGAHSLSKRKESQRKWDEAINDLPEQDPIGPEIAHTTIWAPSNEIEGLKITPSRKQVAIARKSELIATEDGEMHGGSKRRKRKRTEDHNKIEDASNVHNNKQKKRERYPQKGNAAPSFKEEERLQELERISALGGVEEEGEKTKNRKGEAELMSKSRKLGENTEWKEVSKKVKEQDPKQSPKKSQRFIVFIGNLPFTATNSSIIKHFASVSPSSVRHLTHKDKPDKSKGFAFLEFDAYDRMKTCLKLYHHSQFNDGLSPGRKLNVELTAGGGGSKSDLRKTKLREKNVRLKEQRQRRVIEEERLKRVTVSGDYTDEADNSHIHPSRRGIMRTL